MSTYPDISKLEIKYKPIDQLHNWDKNPRGIKKDDYERLKNQIKKLGIYKPLVITEDGTVLGGNMRLRAYRDLGLTEAPVVVVEADTEAKRLEYALSDNDRAGYWEDQDLAELITQHGVEINLEDYKIDLGEPTTLSDLLEQFGPEVEEDEVPETPEDSISELGEVYELGRHRLMCGDSTKKEDVEKLMGGSNAQMVFTDPPYGVDYEGKTKDKLKIENDTNSDTFAASVGNWKLDLGSPVYVCCPAGNKQEEFMRIFREKFYLSSVLIWAKDSMVLGHGDYHFQHEPILYGWLEGEPHKYYGDRKQTTLWSVPRPKSSLDDPTMKPVQLVAKAIQNSSRVNDAVFDPFGGSGTTLIACEQLNRTCYMMELDPKYCDVIRERYQNYVEKTSN